MTAFLNKIRIASCALDFGPSFSTSCIFIRPVTGTGSAWVL